jgi:Ig-like domain CHU_C associated/Secretion system C-terminal sorting domain/Lysyl oxidase
MKSKCLMKTRLITLLAVILPFWAVAQVPCTTTNATGCSCATPGQTNCDLLPDITVSGWALSNYMAGPTEYPQTGAGADNGRLRVSGSTPNIGYGSFTVGSVNRWVCGTDSFTDYNTALANCANPKQLIKQKIYHKNGNAMSFTERWAGTMTYHQSHGHMHVDEWGIFTLRIEDVNDPNPLNWPIVGSGAKLGFCLMDYGTCSGYSGHCRDGQNNILLNADFPNYGLGGGQYNCSPVEQGISSGYTDIYSESLDLMWINIPPGTCNGDYWIVIEVDPHNYFLESNETNNWCAVPFTLTQQVPNGQFVADITPSGSTNLCAGDFLTLTATQGTAYAWSNGATTQAINVTNAGSYTCTVTAPCGTDATAPIVVTTSNTTTAPTGTGATVCQNTSATLTVNGVGTFDWYDAMTGGNLLGSGSSFNTPPLTGTTNFYVERVETTPGMIANVGPATSAIGAGAYSQTNTRYIQFDAMADFTLQSVWVDAGTAGNRTIELRDVSGVTVLASVTQFIPAGQSRVTLGFNVPMGTNYQLGLSSGSLADLYRNSGGVVYPYLVANTASITTSSAGNQYYYFFYDWEIQTAAMVCSTPRTAVTATATPAPTVTMSGLGAAYTTIDPAVTLVGTPAGGTFSGPGISGNMFTPATAGPGVHTITYSYTDLTGCEGVATMSTTVTTATSIMGAMFNVMPAVYPNPHAGRYTLSFDLHGVHAVDLQVFTVTGQSVMRKNYGQYEGAFKDDFNMTDMAKGVYFLELRVDDQKVRTKMVYQ